MGRHEVDGLRAYEVSGDCQVTLVLTISVVDDDQELALAEILDCLCNWGEHRFVASLLIGGHDGSPRPAEAATRLSTYLATTSTSRLTRSSTRFPTSATWSR